MGCIKAFFLSFWEASLKWGKRISEWGLVFSELGQMLWFLRSCRGFSFIRYPCTVFIKEIFRKKLQLLWVLWRSGAFSLSHVEMDGGSATLWPQAKDLNLALRLVSQTRRAVLWNGLAWGWCQGSAIQASKDGFTMVWIWPKRTFLSVGKCFLRLRLISFWGRVYVNYSSLINISWKPASYILWLILSVC